MSALSEGSDTKQRSRNSSSSWFFSLRYGGAFPWPNWNMIANWLSSHSNQGCYKRIYMSSFMYNIANSAVLKCIIMYKIILAVYSIILYTVHEHGPCTVCTMKYMYYTLYTFDVTISTTTQATLHMSIGLPMSCLSTTSGAI